MFRTDGPRERIMVVGGEGVGKSTAAVDIRRMLDERETPGTLYVLDTTYEAERNFYGMEGVEVRTPDGWDDYITAMQDFSERATPLDWLVIDRNDVAYDEAQAGYSTKAFGEDIDNYFIEARKDKDGHPFGGDYGVNWVVIKRMYNKYQTLISRFPGHVIVTSNTEKLWENDQTAPELRTLFGKYGIRPGGNKKDAMRFSTVLLFGQPKEEQWVFTTIRDRQVGDQKRKYVKMEEMVRFTTSYLVGIAGWRM